MASNVKHDLLSLSSVLASAITASIGCVFRRRQQQRQTRSKWSHHPELKESWPRAEVVNKPLYRGKLQFSNISFRYKTVLPSTPILRVRNCRNWRGPAVGKRQASLIFVAQLGARGLWRKVYLEVRWHTWLLWRREPPYCCSTVMTAQRTLVSRHCGDVPIGFHFSWYCSIKTRDNVNEQMLV